MGVRIIAKASHITCMSEYSLRYGLSSKIKLLIGVVFKISGDKLLSDRLCINIHARFDLGGENIKISKVNPQSCSRAPGPVLTSDFIHPLLLLRM